MRIVSKSGTNSSGSRSSSSRYAAKESTLRSCMRFEIRRMRLGRL